MITIVIDGIPVPWKSHQGYGRKSFNPRFKEKQYTQWQIRAQCTQTTPSTGPISLAFIFHMPIPKATSKIRRLAMRNNKIHHLVRPDTTNLVKFYEDCLKSIVFDDDSQVVALNATKVYSEIAKTVIQIEAITCH